MSEFGDAFGTAVEGGLFAKAVGRGSKGLPEAAELQAGHFDEGACLNCGTALTGNYCHACGQKAHLHRTLGAFLHDLLLNFLFSYVLIRLLCTSFAVLFMPRTNG